MPVSSDFGGLDEFRGRLQNIASPGFRRGLSQQLAQEAVSLVADEFLKSQDPYGTPWRPSHQRGELRSQGQILRDTGRLLNSIHGAASDQGFTVSSDVAYAAIHNFGGTISIGARSQTNVHGADGRFTARSKAKRRKGASRVSFSRIGPHQVTIPRRQFIPNNGDLGPGWTDAFRRVFEEAASAG